MDEGSLFADIRFLGPVIAGAISLAVFAGGKVFEIWKEGSEKRSNERRLINALYTEIQHNRQELQTSRDASPPVDLIISKLGEQENRTIFATYSRNTRFFDDLRSDLHILPAPVLEATVRFYNSLESIYATMDGYERASFREMSLAGKRGILEYMIERIGNAIIESGVALNQFEIHFSQIERRRQTPHG